MNEPTNEEAEDGHEEAKAQHALLLESDLQAGPQVVYTRLEWGHRAAHDLGLEEAFEGDRLFRVGAVTLGAARDLFDLGSLQLMLGAHGTVYSVPDLLRPIYGSRPVSVEVFLRPSPKRMMGEGQHDAGTHDGHRM